MIAQRAGWVNRTNRGAGALTYAQDSGTLMAEAMGNWLTQRHKEHKEEKTWWLCVLVASCLGGLV